MGKRDDDTPRRLMTRVRKFVGRETMRHKPKTVYSRSAAKQEMQDIIEEECFCIGMTCTCDEEEE
jgi:hypothetical protein